MSTLLHNFYLVKEGNKFLKDGFERHSSPYRRDNFFKWDQKRESDKLSHFSDY